jgi:hypothetical protein
MTEAPFDVEVSCTLAPRIVKMPCSALCGILGQGKSGSRGKIFARTARPPAQACGQGEENRSGLTPAQAGKLRTAGMGEAMQNAEGRMQNGKPGTRKPEPGKKRQNRTSSWLAATRRGAGGGNAERRMQNAEQRTRKPEAGNRKERQRRTFNSQRSTFNAQRNGERQAAWLAPTHLRQGYGGQRRGRGGGWGKAEPRKEAASRWDAAIL